MLPISNSLILVVLIPSPRDLEIARVLGWYRIPLLTAPKVISVDYLAFYQPASFGDHRWRIEVIAPVKGHELVTRVDLIRDEPDHPRANEEYFKLQLGQLIWLPSQILAEKWKRITFLYTTGQYLLKAKTINELIVHSDERKLLWQSLRERAEQQDEYEVLEPEIPTEVLNSLLGIKDLEESYGIDGDM